MCALNILDSQILLTLTDCRGYLPFSIKSYHFLSQPPLCQKTLQRPFLHKAIETSSEFAMSPLLATRKISRVMSQHNPAGDILSVIEV